MTGSALMQHLTTKQSIHRLLVLETHTHKPNSSCLPNVTTPPPRRDVNPSPWQTRAPEFVEPTPARRGHEATPLANGACSPHVAVRLMLQRLMRPVVALAHDGHPGPAPS